MSAAKIGNQNKKGKKESEETRLKSRYQRKDARQTQRSGKLFLSG